MYEANTQKGSGPEPLGEQQPGIPDIPEREQLPLLPPRPKIRREKIPARAFVLIVKRPDAKFEYAPFKAHVLFAVEIPEKDEAGNADPFAGLWVYKPKYGAIGYREKSLYESLVRTLNSSYSYSWERRKAIPQLRPDGGEIVLRPVEEYHAVVSICFDPYMKRIGAAIDGFTQAPASVRRPTPAAASEPKP